MLRIPVGNIQDINNTQDIVDMNYHHHHYDTCFQCKEMSTLSISGSRWPMMSTIPIKLLKSLSNIVTHLLNIFFSFMNKSLGLMGKSMRGTLACIRNMERCLGPKQAMTGLAVVLFSITFIRYINTLYHPDNVAHTLMQTILNIIRNMFRHFTDLFYENTIEESEHTYCDDGDDGDADDGNDDGDDGNDSTKSHHCHGVINAECDDLMNCGSCINNYDSPSIFQYLSNDDQCHCHGDKDIFLNECSPYNDDPICQSDCTSENSMHALHMLEEDENDFL